MTEETSDPNTVGSPIEPNDVLDQKEIEEIDSLTNQYNALVSPGLLEKVQKAISNALPDQIKNALASAGENLSEQEFYLKAMEVIATGFKTLEEQAARFTVTEEAVINEANQLTDQKPITSLNEICFMRSYQVAHIAENKKFPILVLPCLKEAQRVFSDLLALSPISSPVLFVTIAQYNLLPCLMVIMSKQILTN